MKRTLKNRHIQMISLGSAIGTGLFFGSKDSIALAGPSVLAAYAICGTITYIIVRALAEMSVANPVSGSFPAFAHTYWGPAAGFVAGWNYWFNYVIVSIAELVAISSYVQYWFPVIPGWLTALICASALAALNLGNVKFFGETEYWLSGIKVSAIIAMILFGCGLLLSGPGLSKGVDNLFANGGFFPHGSAGFFMSLAIVMFSFGGTELIGITAGEAENPSRSIPSAVNGIIARICLFYIGSTAIIMMLQPWNTLNQQQSPYVEIFTAIGIPAAAHVLNFIVITAALSAYNSALYTNGRSLWTLARQHCAPGYFAKLNHHQTPGRATIFSAMASLLAALLLYFVPASAFLLAVAVATAAALINWFMILLTHARFKSKQSLLAHEKIPYRLPHYRFFASICYAFLAFVLITMWFVPAMRVAFVITPLWLIILIVAAHTRNAAPRHPDHKPIAHPRPDA